MTKISRAIQALYKIIRHPVLLNRVFEDSDSWKEHVVNSYNLPNGLPVIGIEQLLGKNYNEKLNLFSFLDGGSFVTDIALLKSLAGSIKDCRYFEIGTWRGESVYNVAEAAKECYTLNLSDEELRERGIPEKYIELQAFFSGENPDIVHLKGNSTKFDFRSPGKKFDLIFIDGSHHYHDVRHDTREVFKHLVHKDTIVVWHDYGLTPELPRFEVMAGILDGLDPDFHKRLYHVGHTISAIYINREIPSETLEAPVRPEGYFNVHINYQSIEKGRN